MRKSVFSAETTRNCGLNHVNLSSWVTSGDSIFCFTVEAIALAQSRPKFLAKIKF